MRQSSPLDAVKKQQRPQKKPLEGVSASAWEDHTRGQMFGTRCPLWLLAGMAVVQLGTQSMISQHWHPWPWAEAEVEAPVLATWRREMRLSWEVKRETFIWWKMEASAVMCAVAPGQVPSVGGAVEGMWWRPRCWDLPGPRSRRPFEFTRALKRPTVKLDPAQ